MHPVARPKVARLSVSALAYDTIAADYDAQVRGDDWMRQVLHRHYTRVFRPGERVLDVGCGTGIDATFLAERGIRVLGVDSSAAMIQRLRSKTRVAGVGNLVEARVLNIQDLDQLDTAPLDGLIAAFASLNTPADLGFFAEQAARLVRPHGRLVLHMLNRFSVWEWLGYLARRDWAAARQVGRLKTREFTIGGQSVPHYVYFADEAYRRFFAAGFALRGRYGLGALRPPHTVRRLPAPIVNSLEWLDVRTGHVPLIRDAGRFFVLDLERLPGCVQRSDH